MDGNVAEADFLLDKLGKFGFHLFAARCHFNAFVIASRSIAFSLQAVMSDIDGFSHWYQDQQDVLKGSELGRLTRAYATAAHR